jgi:protein TonB
MRHIDAADSERRLCALLVVSAVVHACALAWVEAPARVAWTPTPPVFIATLRGKVDKPVPLSSALAPAAEIGQPPARRERSSLPAVPAVAGPAAPVAAAPAGLYAGETALAVSPDAAAVPVPAEATATDSASPVAAAASPPTDALDNYGRRLAEIFSQRQQYPRLAALRGWEGEVRVRLSVAREGGLTIVRLERSSGHEVLDRHALAMVEEIGRLPPPPAELLPFAGDLQVVVPVHYRLRKAS